MSAAIVAAAGVVGFACSSQQVIDSSSGIDSGSGRYGNGDDGSSSIGDDGGSSTGDDGGSSTTDSGKVVKKDSGTSGDSGTTTTTGTQLRAGDTAIQGTTSDDYVVYTVTSGATTSLEVVSLGGGTPTVLAPTFDPQSDFALIDGKTVAWWTGVDANTGIGTMSIWTNANGTKAVGGGSIAGFFAAAGDASRFAYSTNATANATDLAVSATDTIAGSTIITNIGSGCQPLLSFASTRLFTATCAGAATTATVRTLAAGSTTTQSVLTSASAFFSADTAGDKVLVMTSAGTMSVKTIGATITSTSVATQVADGFLTLDGTAAVFVTKAGALKTSTTSGTTGTVTSLVTTGVKGVVSAAPDFSHVMAYTLAPDTTNQNQVRIDIQLASATTAGALTPLLATATGFPVGFTQSSAYATYLTDIPASGAPTGTLRSTGTASGSAEKQIAPNVLLARAVTAAGSNKIVFLDNLTQGSSGGGGTADVEISDVAGAGTPSTLQAGVDGFDLTQTKLVYTLPTQGLYVTALP